MLTNPQPDFTQFRDYLLKILPQLLREEPELVATIDGIVARQFPRRDEFARLLDQVTQLRQEINLRLELQSQEMQQRIDLLRQEMEQRLTALRQDMQQRIDLLRQEMEQRLTALREDMQQRFEQMDKRFEQVDKRFEQMDKRFEQMDKRFEQVDQQLANLQENVGDLQEKVGDLQEKVGDLQEKVGDLQEKVGDLQENMGNLQENVGKLQTDNVQIKRDILKLQAGQANILKTLTGQEAWLKVAIGGLRNDKGQTLEDMFAAGLRYGLKDEEITPETIRLRTPLTDFEGLVFKKGYVTEVDVVAQNGKLTVFEVKATAKAGDVDVFAWKVELIKAQSPTLSVRGVFICLGAPAAVKQRCLENGLDLLD